MKCSEIQEQLSAYHDGELASEMREIVAAHVADCDNVCLATRRIRELLQLVQPASAAGSAADGMGGHRQRSSNRNRASRPW